MSPEHEWLSWKAGNSVNNVYNNNTHMHQYPDMLLLQLDPSECHDCITLHSNVKFILCSLLERGSLVYCIQYHCYVSTCHIVIHYCPVSMMSIMCFTQPSYKIVPRHLKSFKDSLVTLDQVFGSPLPHVCSTRTLRNLVPYTCRWPFALK